MLSLGERSLVYQVWAGERGAAHRGERGLLVGLQVGKAVAELQDGRAAICGARGRQPAAFMYAQRGQRARRNLPAGAMSGLS